MSNINPEYLPAGVFGVSHGGGTAGELIRHATGSWAGHAILYLGGGVIVSGEPPVAVVKPATAYDDAIWAHRMWDQLGDEHHWTPTQIQAMQDKAVSRGHALVGVSYDYEAYAAFALMVLKIRNTDQLAPVFSRNAWRVCSALVDDAETFAGVPMDFIPSDGPGLTAHPGKLAVMPPNLVTPGMLLGLAQRKEWA